jgi:hypothetical protein
MQGGVSAETRPVRALERQRWRALPRMLRTCEHPLDFALRSFAGTGAYPACPQLRTPLGLIAPAAHTPEDARKLYDVFCRLDLSLPADASVVVDAAAEDGIGSMYFLTRAPDVRCYLLRSTVVHPERVEGNLAAWEDRYELIGESARRDEADGDAPREVSPEELGEALAEVFAREERVDMLWLGAPADVEALLAGVQHELLERVRVVCYETRADQTAGEPTGAAG